jgi:2-polyprenyl-6-methoxyphenol hydroxylase-like FAD-dependent oxidoreductase
VCTAGPHVSRAVRIPLQIWTSAGGFYSPNEFGLFYRPNTRLGAEALQVQKALQAESCSQFNHILNVEQRITHFGNKLSPTMSENNFDVIIAGAGPAGLFLACELALAQVSVLVIEKRRDHHDTWFTGPLGNRGLNVPSTEALYRRDLLAGIFGDLKRRPTEINPGVSAGHFGGLSIPSSHIDASRYKYSLPGPASNGGPCNLGKLMSLLADRAQDLGAKVVCNTTLWKIEDRGDAVDVWTEPTQQEAEHDDEDQQRQDMDYLNESPYTSKYLVGADGGRSTVRHLGGFTFQGSEPQWTGYAAECRLDRSQSLQKGFVRTERGMYITSPMSADVLYLMDFDRGSLPASPTDRAITRDRFQEVARQVTGIDLDVLELRRCGVFTDRTKQATQYVRGRILLIGDAAHIHAPLGGQGLNLGVGDAMNLGWKLAATIKGQAAANLLSTYQEERHPVATATLDWTRAQTEAIRPDQYGSAVRSMVSHVLNTPDGAKLFSDRFSGRTLRYGVCHVSQDDHEAVGLSAPDFEFMDGTRLGNRLQRGKFVLIDFGGQAGVAESFGSSADMLTLVDCRCVNSLDFELVLVRPDGVIAWATDRARSTPIDGLRDALERYLRRRD